VPGVAHRDVQHVVRRKRRRVGAVKCFAVAARRCARAFVRGFVVRRVTSVRQRHQQHAVWPAAGRRKRAQRCTVGRVDGVEERQKGPRRGISCRCRRRRGQCRHGPPPRVSHQQLHGGSSAAAQRILCGICVFLYGRTVGCWRGHDVDTLLRQQRGVGRVLLRRQLVPRLDGADDIHGNCSSRWTTPARERCENCKGGRGNRREAAARRQRPGRRWKEENRARDQRPHQPHCRATTTHACGHRGGRTLLAMHFQPQHPTTTTFNNGFFLLSLQI
jgi:hypothetical protein